MAWRALVDSFDEFAITSFRVIRKGGFVTRSVRQIPLEKVQDVNVRSTLGGRWLSYGDVELQTAGSDSTVVFPRILHPEEFRNVLFTHTRLHGATDGLGGRAAAAPPSRASLEERLKEAERLYRTGVDLGGGIPGEKAGAAGRAVARGKIRAGEDAAVTRYAPAPPKPIAAGAGELVPLDPDHPGFRDAIYRARRNEIARMALAYRDGDPLPRVSYTPEEEAVWRAVWEKLGPLHERLAAAPWRESADALSLDRTHVPQLADVSETLKAGSGFRMIPVAGHDGS